MTQTEVPIDEIIVDQIYDEGELMDVEGQEPGPGAEGELERQ